MLLSACVIPGDEPGDLASKAATISRVNAALNAGDCSSAIQEVEGLYNSAASDDEVRRLRASAHGCRFGLGFLEKIEDLASADLATHGPWRAITLLFPSAAGDNRAESSFFATDALQAWLKPDVVVMNPLRIDLDPYNPGSMRVADHTVDANIYLVLTSMATIGTLHNRYGAPNALGAPTRALPWSGLQRVDQEGCGYVSAILMMNEALTEVGAEVSQLSGLVSAMAVASAGFNNACRAGCTACGISCTVCPPTLRHRSACDRALTTTKDLEACAAAGLVNSFMNNAVVGWR